jgi:predicted dehydrogenase
MRGRLRTALIGAGYWGPSLLRNAASLPEYEVLHVVDLRAERAEAAAARFAPRADSHSDLQRALLDERVDAVIVATPAATHFEVAHAALLAGKHTLVEKPLSMRADECTRLIDLAAARERTLMVGHLFRYNAAVDVVQRLITSGEVGEILYVHGRRVNLGRVQADINALWSFAPHDLSILAYWLGAHPLRASARGFSCLQHSVEDVVFCTLEYPGGRGAHLHMGWLDPRKVRELTVVGTKRMVVFDDVSPDAKVRVFESSGSEMPRAPESFAEWAVDLRHGDVSIPRIDWVEPLRAELQHFADCLLGGLPCRTPGSDGLAVTRTIEALQQSLRQDGTPIVIDR